MSSEEEFLCPRSTCMDSPPRQVLCPCHLLTLTASAFSSLSSRVSFSILHTTLTKCVCAVNCVCKVTEEKKEYILMMYGMSITWSVRYKILLHGSKCIDFTHFSPCLANSLYIFCTLLLSLFLSLSLSLFLPLCLSQGTSHSLSHKWKRHWVRFGKIHSNSPQRCSCTVLQWKV